MAVKDERIRLLGNGHGMEIVSVRPVGNEIHFAIRHDLPDFLRVRLSYDRTALEPRVDQALEPWFVPRQEAIVKLLSCTLRTLEHLDTAERPRVVERKDLGQRQIGYDAAGVAALDVHDIPAAPGGGQRPGHGEPRLERPAPKVCAQSAQRREQLGATWYANGLEGRA